MPNCLSFCAEIRLYWRQVSRSLAEGSELVYVVCRGLQSAVRTVEEIGVMVGNRARHCYWRSFDCLAISVLDFECPWPDAVLHRAPIRHSPMSAVGGAAILVDSSVPGSYNRFRHSVTDAATARDAFQLGRYVDSRGTGG